jgi:hypothetical protein
MERRLLEAWATANGSGFENAPGKGVIERFLPEMELLSNLNLWRVSKVDLLINHELFNLIDSILESLTLELRKKGSSFMEDEEMKDQTETSGGVPESRPETDQKVAKVLKFLKIVLIYATNAHYFSSVDVSFNTHS